jgi:DNA-directed RNA polymerase subunit M/transcription elongation factor TFIIS
MKENDQAPLTNPKSQIRNPKSDESEAEPVRTPRVRAGECPANESHVNTRVYRTIGEVRYCVCDDCGRTWKKTGPAAGPKLAKEKERAPA